MIPRVRTIVLLLAAVFIHASPCYAGAIVVDHTSTDLSKIPEEWIDAVKHKVKVYYGHTSHGQQLVSGMQMIKTRFGRKYDVFVYENSLPNVGGALSVRNTSDTYDPQDFFVTIDKAVAMDPKINVVMYGWCSQPNNGNWETALRKYIEGMNAFEKKYPGITFVYMTAHAQRKDSEGCNRHRFNEALREYCIRNGKVLYDFGDIDAWHGGTANSYVAPGTSPCAGQSIPLEHGKFGGGGGEGPCFHTNGESCLVKGNAAWWLLARIAGWDPSTSSPAGRP